MKQMEETTNKNMARAFNQDCQLSPWENDFRVRITGDNTITAVEQSASNYVHTCVRKLSDELLPLDLLSRPDRKGCEKTACHRGSEGHLCQPRKAGRHRWDPGHVQAMNQRIHGDAPENTFPCSLGSSSSFLFLVA